MPLVARSERQSVHGSDLHVPVHLASPVPSRYNRTLAVTGPSTAALARTVSILSRHPSLERCQAASRHAAGIAPSQGPLVNDCGTSPLILSTAAFLVIQHTPLLHRRRHGRRLAAAAPGHPTPPSPPCRRGRCPPLSPIKGVPEPSRASSTFPLPPLEPLFSYNCGMAELCSVLAMEVAEGPRTTT